MIAHNHTHNTMNVHSAFAVGIALNTAYIMIEVIYGLKADSLALLADAGHNTSDVLSLLVAWGATSMAQKKPTQHRTYGFRRTTILASLVNAIILLIAIGAVAWEAIQRISHPQPVVAGVMIWVASVGVLINAGTALLFLKGRRQDLNIKGAFLHMAADAGVSGGVVLAGIVMILSSSTLLWIDSMVSLIIVAVIAIGTWGVLRDSVNLALDAVPKEIDPTKVREYLAQLPGVCAVHDLHIWAMSTTETALTVHLVIPTASIDDSFLGRIQQDLQNKFAIAHATLQVERGDSVHPCGLDSEERV